MSLLDELEYTRMSSEGEYAWVISGWKFSHSKQWNKMNPEHRGQYYTMYRPYIEKRLEQHPPLIAVLKEEPLECVGFTCGQKGHLYYTYVKKIYRRNGVAGSLMSEECGDKPGKYHTVSEKQFWMESLRRKGWEYEKEEC